MDVHQELADLRTSLASATEHVEAVEAEVGAVRPGFSGTTAGAQENRTVHTALARLAQQQAREMREGLDRLRAQAATMASEARGTRVRLRRDGQRRRTRAAPPADRLHEVALELSAVDTRDDVLIRLVAGVVRVVPGARWAGVCHRRHDGSLLPEAVSAPVVRDLLALHDTLRGGPCCDALDAGSPGSVAVPDLARDPRWPRLADRAGPSGVRCLLVHRIEGPRLRSGTTTDTMADRVLGAGGDGLDDGGRARIIGLMVGLAPVSSGPGRGTE